MKRAITIVLLAMAFAVSGHAAARAAVPAAAAPDRIALQAERIDSIHWEVIVWLDNQQMLAALTIPLHWGHGHSRFMIDSVNYQGLRTDYFALKTFLPDSADHTVLIGLISDLGTGLPPLEPGSGPIARLYFTSRTPTSRPLRLDTTFIPPHNTLQVVTPDVRTLTPVFDAGIRGVEAKKTPR